MFLGLDPEAWTAIGSIAAVLTLAGTAIGFLVKVLRGRSTGNQGGPASGSPVEPLGEPARPADNDRGPNPAADGPADDNPQVTPPGAPATGETPAADDPNAESSDSQAADSHASEREPSTPSAEPEFYVEAPSTPVKLKLMPTGGPLLAVVTPAVMYQQGYDEPTTKDEVELVAGFLRQCQDWGEILGDLDAGAQVEAGWELSRELEALREAGWLVYAGLSKRTAVVNGQRMDWPTAIVKVVRQPAAAAA